MRRRRCLGTARGRLESAQPIRTGWPPCPTGSGLSRCSRLIADQASRCQRGSTSRTRYLAARRRRTLRHSVPRSAMAKAWVHGPPATPRLAPECTVRRFFSTNPAPTCQIPSPRGITSPRRQPAESPTPTRMPLFRTQSHAEARGVREREIPSPGSTGPAARLWRDIRRQIDPPRVERAVSRSRARRNWRRASRLASMEG